MYFPVQYEKTQEKPKLFEKTQEKTQGNQKKTQEPKIGSKNPRSWEKTQGVATLLESLRCCAKQYLLNTIDGASRIRFQELPSPKTALLKLTDSSNHI